MKIGILEKTNFSEEQISKLRKVGEVDFYEGLSQDEANKIAINYDVIIVNWLDPTPFIMNMKPRSLISLLSTGYGWITNIKEAYEKRIYVSNIPDYSTEAVAEHLLGMLLGVSKNIFSTFNKANNNIVGFELKNKVVGIIGLGNIGSRFAEIMNFFGAEVITYNRTKKNNPIVRNVALSELLEQSDIICISCSVNDNSKDMINLSNIKNIKKGAIIIGSTWGIIENDAMLFAVKNDIVRAVSLDAAIEGGNSVEEEIKKYSDKIFLTPHIAYNTLESENRQLDICINNIVNYIKGTPQNIIF
ncbi:MAG: 2-hydroxyacid dehydrogenase [Clostridium sp.]|nr:2-hydroxyacid dehydrogenase [Clostridium sp.]